MGLYWTLVALGFVTLLCFIAEKCKGYTVKATLMKSIVSALFMMVAIFTAFQQPADSATRSMAFFIVAGCLFGLLGDIWLDLKFVHPSDEKRYTYAGFCVFGVMHIIIVVGAMINFHAGLNALYFVVPILLGFVIGAVNVMLDKVMKLDYGPYKLISGIYGGILIATTLLFGSLSLASGFHNAFLNAMLIGYVLFLISDLVLCQTYFAGHEEKPYIAVNYATYYAAMYIIASAGLFLV